MIGNPARRAGWLSAYGSKLLFIDGYATCEKKSGEQYSLHDDIVKKV